jgi:hypothetical protein
LATSPEKTVAVTVSWPWLKMPPPCPATWALNPGPVALAEAAFAVSRAKVLPWTVAVPALMNRPPPDPTAEPNRGAVTGPALAVLSRRLTLVSVSVPLE